MMAFIIYVVIIVLIFRYTRKKRKASSNSRGRAADKASQASPSAAASTSKKNLLKRQKASARPNQKRETKQTAQEKQYSAKTRGSSDNCSYEAAYSKGQPARLGLRGDYGEEVRQGQICVRCGYCGAENLVPAGSREHYHCYFCWEKL
ncbi:MAG: hypothetical protein LUD73_05195 [Lachnospiraceae bacterium]|nr:hypothetical protein [Lachnospiraceae bacterium]MCD8249767.1 hypothetical protein [Lachnospiraceae bacterium]